MLIFILRLIFGRKNIVFSICWGVCGFFFGIDIGVEVILIFLFFFLEEGDSKGFGVFFFFLLFERGGKKIF